MMQKKPKKETRTSIEIATALLDRTNHAYDSNDFEAFADCFEFPNSVGTFSNQRIIEDKAEMKIIFEEVRAHFLNLGVTDYVRHCVHAEFHEPGLIHSTHESRLLNGNTLIRRPYPVFSQLRNRTGKWRIVSSSYAIGEDPLHEQALSGKPPDDSKT